MKQGIHPTFYPDALFTCGSCGTTWRTGSTKNQVHVDICSNCHPFYTGTQRIVDTAGQVERFTKRLQARETVVAAQGEGKGSKKQRRAQERAKRSGMLEAMQPEPAAETPAVAVAKTVGEAIGTAEAVVEGAVQALGEGVSAAAQAVSNIAGGTREPRRPQRPPRPPRERKPRQDKPAESSAPTNEGDSQPA